MAGTSASEVSQLLRAWNDGDESALEKLMPIVYDELHRMARQYMARESPGHMLQTTALVNEAYLRLVDAAHTNFQNRIHFFAVCAQAMRRILADWARSRQALKRGGEVQPLRLDEALDAGDVPGVDFAALDEALKGLSKVDPRKSQVVELHFFGGLNMEETAEVMKISSDTVLRDWKMAKSWLRCELSGEKWDGA
ncbi:MAG TPA: sigma-70 family RNA polymerase sigma factor [Terriglobia bacterium]|nr:sigma-70 family RNA polymerase sigma factor [Terriglobia bacterium]